MFSTSYHQRRRRFFEGLDTLASVLSLIFGSAVIYGILAANFQALALACAALVTVAAAINLVVGSNRKAWLHADLARRFIELECQLRAARLAIETDEPPILRVLDSLCHNEVLRAQGQDGRRVGPIA